MYPEQDGNTALIHAASYGREGCVRLLLNSGADQTIRNKVHNMHNMCINVLICVTQAHRSIDASLYIVRFAAVFCDGETPISRRADLRPRYVQLAIIIHRVYDCSWTLPSTWTQGSRCMYQVLYFYCACVVGKLQAGFKQE
jgi:hypothetical protein